MPKIEWHDKLNINVAQVDEQHQKLLHMAHGLHQALETKQDEQILLEKLEALLEYTRMHFAHEEALMAEHDYPDLQSHQQEHLHLLNQAASLRDALARGQPLTGRANFDASDDWVLAHVCGADRKLGLFLNQKQVF